MYPNVSVPNLSDPADIVSRAERSDPNRAFRLSFLAAAALVALLAFFALGRLGGGAAGMLQPAETTFGESILFDHAARIVRGEPLYQPPDRIPYTVAAYTPVYYLLAAALQSAAGRTFLPGRALSFVAGIAAALFVGLLAGRRVRSLWAGVVAALLFLTLGFPGRIPFYALYKEDVLGVAFALGAIAALAGGDGTRRVVLAAALAALAILTKQTLIAAALAGTIWLFLRDRRKAFLFASVAASIVLATAAGFQVGTRGAFLANAFSANAVPFRWDALLENLDTLRQFQTVPLFLAAFYVFVQWRGDRKPQQDLLVLYWAACLPAIAGFARPGSAHNYWIELAASTAVLAALSVWTRLGRRGTVGDQRGVLVLILVLGVTVAQLVRGFGSAAVPVRSLRQATPKPDPEFFELVGRVHSEPREVLADPPDVVVLAGRRNLLELYFSSIRYASGRLDLNPLVRRICRGEIGLLAIKYKLDSEARGIYQGYPFWPPPVLAALRERMVLQREQAGRFLYVPRADAAGAPPASSAPGVCARAAALP